MTLLRTSDNWDETQQVHLLRATEALLHIYPSNAPSPRRIRHARRYLRRAWPELAGQLDLLTALARHDPEPVR